MSSVIILSTGTSIPSKVISNSDLEKIVDTNDEWITARTGIKERRMADENHASSDLGAEAALKAIEKASINPLDIDVVIVATITPDYLFPSTACLIQKTIGADNAYAFDLSAGCSGYLYAMQVAKGMIDGGGAETILIIGAETLTRVTDYEDRGTCILFGDGAGATILQKSEQRGILSICLGSDGGGWDLLYQPGGGSRMPSSVQSVENKEHYLKMNGKEVFKIAVTSMGNASVQAIEEAGLKPEDIDLFIAHQANYRIMDAVRKRLKMPTEKVFMNISKYGNTSSASVPIALDEALEQGKIKEGDLILFSVFGAGFTWGASVIKW
ncbi:MAG: ketoacyl-ACP synthase III [Candidatus Dadabacteria bacterium]|nr:ketoacyl-ACP synthase III [Candidatus Dadabacteria bacterium]NIS09567.1 ketoacyl-ACP synthase III [Candidatus Dadabacteria bacterium]NIV43076.1 beta-ketoacyl-ACP synthase III [Candidatus Dadabacteria bacterium]NIX16041.1 beta-ketoacyl-ACP synthase III [Candidatus Dadabacteria bacterium]NIY22744.1 beta-ketoacyl-ACP synthase III [Candidatus Dadabacteria bacterium]